MKKYFPLLLLASACASATGDATNIRVTGDPNVVKDCVRLGEVRASGWWGNPFNEVERTGENAMRKEAARMGADTVLITYQLRSSSAGEAYRCSQAGQNFRPAVTWTPSYPQKNNEASAPTPTPKARPAEASGSVQVRTVRTFEAVAGCTYLAEANPQAKCQKPYEEPTACMAWQAAAQGGNTLLLDGEKGHIYRCAKPSR